MSKLDEFPKADNTPAGKEARLARLLKVQRERELSRIMEKLYTPNENISMGELEDVIKGLLSLDPFGKDLELKKECQEVLGLLDVVDMTQYKRYLSLIKKLQDFLYEKGIYTSEKLP